MALTTDIVAYWKFDESSGTTAADATGNGNTGTLTGTIPPIQVGGKINNAIQFDGVNNAINIGVLFPTGAATWSAWIYPTGDDSNYRSIFANWTPSNCIYVGQEIGSTDKLTAYFNGALIFTTGGFFTPNTWVHLTIVHTGSQVSVYKNAVLFAGPYSSNLIAPVGVTAIGGDIGRGNYYWKGKIDEVGIWSRALTVAEVEEIYNGGAGLQYPFASNLNNSAFLNFM